MNAPARPNATTMAPGVPRAISLGEWCVQRGLVTPTQVEEGLAFQREQQDRLLPPLRLGQILLERGHLTTKDLMRALASQRRELRHCPDCRLQTTVPIGSPAARHRCATCNLSLIPSPDAPIDAGGDSLDGGGDDELPEEVRTAALTPANRFGKYVLVRELGRGGVGRVCLAWDTFLSQYVAVKRLRTDVGGQTPDLIEERRRMLLKEARAAIRLRHPGLVSVYDVGRVDEELYISMEFVDGVTLHEMLQSDLRAGHLAPYFAGPERLLRTLSEIATAIDYAHTRPAPIIHCDLKPSNIMIDREQHARILDFGLARNIQADAGEQSDLVSGTPGYMAPEQARGELGKIDARTDIYAFGAILYECLTGRTPFTGPGFEVLHRTLSDTPDFPSAALAAGPRAHRLGTHQIPAALETLCMACLEREPDRRPCFLGDIAASLDALAVAPTPTPSPSAAIAEEPAPTILLKPSLSPRPSRHTARFILGAIVLALLGLGLLSFVWKARTESSALAAFHPEHGASDEATLVAGLKKRLIEGLRGTAPAVPALRLRDGRFLTLRGIAQADADGLEVSTAEGLTRVDWNSVEPLQIADLVLLSIPDPTPDDRLALAVYLLRTGHSEQARRILLTLRSTARAVQAERYLGEAHP